MALYTEEHILEAERRAEQRVRAEMSVGYIFHNPDIGTEILPYHPVSRYDTLVSCNQYILIIVWCLVADFYPSRRVCCL